MSLSSELAHLRLRVIYFLFIKATVTICGIESLFFSTRLLEAPRSITSLSHDAAEGRGFLSCTADTVKLERRRSAARTRAQTDEAAVVLPRCISRMRHPQPLGPKHVCDYKTAETQRSDTRDDGLWPPAAFGFQVGRDAKSVELLLSKLRRP